MLLPKNPTGVLSNMAISDLFSYIGFLLSLFAALYVFSKSLNISLSRKHYSKAFKNISGRSLAYVTSFSLILCLVAGGYYVLKGITLFVNDTLLSILIALPIQIAIALILFSFPNMGMLKKFISAIFFIMLLIMASGFSYIYIYTEIVSRQYDESQFIKLYDNVIYIESQMKKELDSLSSSKDLLFLELMKELSGLGKSSIKGFGPISNDIKKEYDRLNYQHNNLKKKHALLAEEVKKIGYFIESDAEPVNITQSITKINSKILANENKYTITFDDYQLSSPSSLLVQSIHFVKECEYPYAATASLLFSVAFEIFALIFGILLSLINSKTKVEKIQKT